jgi:hypothetical protein
MGGSPLYGNDGDMQQQIKELRREVQSLKEAIRLLERTRKASWITGLKIVLAKTTAPIPKGTAGAIQVHEDIFPGEDPTETIIAINRFGWIGNEKWCIAVWIERNQKWYIVAAEC